MKGKIIRLTDTEWEFAISEQEVPDRITIKSKVNKQTSNF